MPAASPHPRAFHYVKHTPLGFFLPVALLFACSMLVVACDLLFAPCYGRTLVTLYYVEQVQVQVEADTIRVRYTHKAVLVCCVRKTCTRVFQGEERTHLH
jgi:hypothetical protein